MSVTEEDWTKAEDLGKAVGAIWDTAPIAQALADEREKALAPVLALTYWSTDGGEYDHNPRCSGEAECPACWAAAIRRAAGQQP